MSNADLDTLARAYGMAGVTGQTSENGQETPDRRGYVAAW